MTPPEIDNWHSLVARTLKWAEDRGILAQGTAQGQADKLLEEVLELREALFTRRSLERMLGDTVIMNPAYVSRVKEAIEQCRADEEDAVGDIMVTLLNFCEVSGTDLNTGFDKAVNVIEKRTGRMVNGKFVKDA